MWAYHRIWRISWLDQFINVNVLDIFKKKVEVMSNIKRRKMLYFDHVMKNNAGKISGKRSVKELKGMVRVQYHIVFRAAASKLR